MLVGAGIAVHALASDSQSGRAQSQVRYIATQRHLFSDPKTVNYSVVGGDDVLLKTTASGVVTDSTCAAGARLASGTSPYAVDETPIVAMSSGIPMWRDLAVGDSGSDVASLQAELSRLGYPVRADGTLGTETLAAFGKLRRSLGSKGETTLTRSTVLWLPAETMIVKECDAHVGDTIAVGDTVVTLVGGARSGHINDIPRDMVVGARVLVLDDQRLPVASDGVIPDIPPSTVRALPSAKPSGDAGANSGESSATLELADAIEVVGLPPSSIYAVENSSGCVLSKSGPFQVEVVASQLGQTFVRFADSKIPDSVQLNRKDGPACR